MGANGRGHRAVEGPRDPLEGAAREERGLPRVQVQGLSDVVTN